MCDESMDIIVTNDSGRKRHLASKEEFEKSRKPVKLKKAKLVEAPIMTSKIIDILRKDTPQPQPGTSKEATLPALLKSNKIPPRVAKFKKVETLFINVVRAQTSGMVSFEYTQGGLKIRTSVEADHKAVLSFLRDRGWNFSPLTLILYIR